MNKACPEPAEGKLKVFLVVIFANTSSLLPYLFLVNYYYF